MLRRMLAIILGVTAVAMLNALVSPDASDAISRRRIQGAAVAESFAERISPATEFGVNQSGTQTGSESISPFEMARVIINVRRTRVDVSLKETWQKLGIEPGSFEECGSDCKARIYRHELSSQRGPEVVVKLTRFFDSCRYLVFARNEDGRRWKFLGHVDHAFNKYEMARHRIAPADGRPFLVIRGQEGSGSGFALYAETWYDVSERGVNAVLSYPSDGHTNPWPAGLARSFQATQTSGAGRTTIQYTVSYDTAGYDNDNLKLEFINRHRASYNWDSQSKRFVFDAKQSNISEAEIAAIANIQSDDEPKAGTKIGETTFYSSSEAGSFLGGGYEVFLKYNTARLMTIAKGRETKAKAWLRQFLTECRDTDERKALLIALGK
ncbi:MAG: hypothetical protein ACXW18_00810 [Pyrinomonadaceae bacterium]